MKKIPEQQTIDTAIQAIQPKLTQIDQEIAKHKIPPDTVYFFDEKGKKIAEGSTQREWIHEEQPSRHPKQSVIPQGTASIVSNGSIKMDIIAGDAEKMIIDKKANTTRVFGHLPVKLLVKGNVEAEVTNYGSSVIASEDIRIKEDAYHLTSGRNISVGGALKGKNEAKGSVEAGATNYDSSTVAGGDIRIKGRGYNLVSDGNISVGNQLAGKNEARSAIKAGSIDYGATVVTPIIYLQEGTNVSSLKAKVGFIPEKEWNNFSPTRELPAFATVKEVTPLSRLESGKLSLSSECKYIGGTVREIASGEGGFEAGLLCVFPKNTGMRQK